MAERLISRRSLLKGTFSRIGEQVLRPFEPLATFFEGIATPEQWLIALGVDGQTVWEARELPLVIKSLDSNRADQQLTVTEVDFQVHQPKLVLPRIFSQSDELPPINIHGIQAEIPTSTGFFAKYLVDLGLLIGIAPLFKARRYKRKEALTCYTHLNRYYDNKTVNVGLSLVKLINNMHQAGIVPRETFSFLKEAAIGELINNRQALYGFGIGEIATNKRGLEIMYGGGICSGVTTLAKAIRQAELRLGVVKITQMKPHSVPELRYFFNPSDPDFKNQIDATAYYPTVDFQFVNLTDKTLYLVPKMQIIADPPPDVPRNYNGLYAKTAILVMSFTLRTTAPTKQEVASITGQLTAFRSLRRI